MSNEDQEKSSIPLKEAAAPAPPAAGLSTAEVEALRQQYGPNEIAEKKTYPIFKFLGFFWGPIPWMIEAAAIIAAVIGRWDDFSIILAMLLLNAGVGFWQRQKADHAIDLLKQKLALNAKVCRDGQWQTIPARELVPGDLVRVRLGDIVPADINLLTGDYLMVDQSTLTGESLPVEKKAGELVYTGSIVRQGEMDAQVTNTGMNTYFGRTAKLVEEARTQSHFQKALIKIGDYLMLMGAGMVVIIFLVSLFRHQNILETLQYALVLTVAAVPATLPAVLSVTLAVGAGVLAARGAIAAKMAALDELAGMDVLCCDKTGTITQNALSIARVVAFDGFSEAEVLRCGGLASRAEDNDPIDLAIIHKIEASAANDFQKDSAILSFKPFDPVSKRTEAEVAMKGGAPFRVTKGAPQVISVLMAEDDPVTREVDRLVEEFATHGYRALGVARADSPGPWRYVGLIALYDPPREDSLATIKEAQNLGVQVKMITGDHVAIAQEIARAVNLGTNIQPPALFLDKPDREAQGLVEEADGFAQVFPEDKYHIVELLQKSGHIVGMTGDGVNDAPALKKADVGIAVAGATDAAKSAADIVLTSPGLSVIVEAIQEARKIFQRMNSYAIYRIGGILRVVFFITLSLVIFNFYAVTSIMVILQVLLNDIPILSIAYDSVRSDDKPVQWDMRVVMSIATYLGLMGVIFSFILFYIGLVILHLDQGTLQTLNFLKFTISGYLYIYMGRTRGLFWTLKPGALMLWSGIISRALATAIALLGWYVPPISWQLVGLVWGLAVVELLVTDPLKLVVYRVLDHTDIIFRRRLQETSR
jgi:H+-transporting ATPase